METGFKGIRNINGRPKGSLNKTSADTKELIQNIVSREIDTIDTLLSQLTPKERIDAIIRLLPYIVPKQAEIVIDSAPERPRTTISWGGRIIEI